MYVYSSVHFIIKTSGWNIFTFVICDEIVIFMQTCKILNYTKHYNVTSYKTLCYIFSILNCILYCSIYVLNNYMKVTIYLKFYL